MRNYTSAAILVLLLSTTFCSMNPHRYLDKGNALAEAGNYAEADLNYQKALQADPNFGEACYRLGLSKFHQGKLVESAQILNRAAELMPNHDEVKVALADTSFASYLRDARDTEAYNQVHLIAQFLLQKDSNSYDGLRLQGYVLMLDKHYSDAIASLKRAHEIKPAEADVIDALAQALMSDGQTAEGEKMALDLIAQQKSHRQTYDILYTWYMGHNRRGEAESLLKLKVANNPAVMAYRLQLGAHFISVGNEAALASTLKEITDDSSRFPDGQMDVGLFYFSMKRYDEALRQFEAGAKQNNARKAEYQKYAVQVLLLQNKGDQALALLGEMLKADPTNPDARYYRAVMYFNSNDTEKQSRAYEDLRALVKESPNNAVYHYDFGRACVAKGEIDAAVAEFTQALRLDPSYLAPRLVIANISLDRQDYQRANQYADEILRLTNNDPSARIVKAASLMGLGIVNQASDILNQLDREYPDSPALRLQRGELLRARKQYKEAVNLFRTLYESDRRNLVPLQRLIDTYYDMGEYSTAIQYLTNERNRNNSPEITSLLGEAALRGKKLDLAVQQYSTLASTDPKSAMYHLKLGDAYLQKGSVNEAIDQFVTARQLAPKDALVNAMLALAFHNAGRADEAQKSYRDTLALQSDNPQVKNNLAYLISEFGGNLDDALKLAQEASRAMPSNMAMMDTLGWIYFKKKAPDSAIQVLSNVVQKEPKQPIYRYHLASALFQKGDIAGTRRELQAALSNQPNAVYEGKIKELMTRIPN